MHLARKVEDRELPLLLGLQEAQWAAQRACKSSKVKNVTRSLKVSVQSHIQPSPLHLTRL